VTAEHVASFLPGIETPALARRQLDRWLPASLGDAERGALRLLVSELVTNCVRHAVQREDEAVQLAVRVAAERIRVEVRDGGPGFEPEATPRPHGADGGYGLFLVERMASRWGVDQEQGTRVWFELDLATATR
jgi:anti-sigma regulatory factor (Ser/Thr protein kinase)